MVFLMFFFFFYTCVSARDGTEADLFSPRSEKWSDTKTENNRQSLLFLPSPLHLLTTAWKTAKGGGGGERRDRCLQVQLDVYLLEEVQ